MPGDELEELIKYMIMNRINEIKFEDEKGYKIRIRIGGD